MLFSSRTARAPLIRIFRTLWAAALLLPLTLLTLTGCERHVTPLRVATIQWIGYQPLHLAQTHGHFDPLPVRLADFLSNRDSLRAFRNRNVDVAALTLDEALLLRNEGHDVRVILVLDYSNGADAIVSRPEVRSLGELEGRRVGVESMAAGAYLLARGLEHAGLNGEDVEIVNIGAEQQVSAYREGRVDALATFEPLRTRLLRLGARELFNSTRMPGEIVDVLVTRQSTVEQRPEDLERLLRGWFRALDHTREQPRQSSRELAAALDLETGQYLEAVGGLRFPSLEENCELFSGDASQLQFTAGALSRFMEEKGLLQRHSPYNTLFSAHVLKRLGCDTHPGQSHGES